MSLSMGNQPGPPLASSSLRLYSRRLGTRGPAILGLHGLAASSRYWGERLAPLAMDHRLNLIDLLGFGRSPRPSGRYTVARHLRAIECFRQVAGLADETLTLLGHSLGARLAVAYAAKQPTAIRGRILLSLPLYRDRAAAQRHISQESAMSRVTVANGPAAYLICKVTCALRPWLGPLLPHFIRDLPREVVEDGIAHTWASFSTTLDSALLDYNPVPDLRALADSPLLLIHGEGDQTAPVDAVRALANTLPQAELVVVPRAGHHVLLTHPGPCLAAMRAFLERIDGTPS